MTTKLPTRTKTQGLLPSAAVRGAYDLKLTAEAAARLTEIEEIRAYAAEQAAAAAAISITDDDSDARAAEVTVNLTKARKALEELQKFFTQPLEGAKKAVIAVFKKLGEDALGQEERLRREAEAHFMKKENARREAERKRLAEEQERQRRARALGRSAPAPLEAPPAAEVDRTVAAENGSRSIKLVWGFDVNPGQEGAVPREYLSLDKKKVDAAIAAGVRQIPGLTISERPQTAVR